jgi:cell division septation protein DedD
MAHYRLILLAWIPIVDVQAKDRLTGAVILVVLLVLVVPELLSGPGRKVAAVAMHPSDEPPLRSYTVELGDEARTRHGSAPGPATATPPSVATTQPAAATPPTPTTVPALATTSQQEPLKETAAVASPVQPASATQPPVAGWIVQLGSFASRANAERLVRELKAKGFAAFWTESASGGRKLYRVRVGPAADHASGEALRAKLRSAGHPGSLTQRP